MKHDYQTDLSPCPKCGSTPVLETGHYGREPYRVVCRDCIDGDVMVEIAVDAFGRTRDAARAAWIADRADERDDSGEYSITGNGLVEPIVRVL